MFTTIMYLNCRIYLDVLLAVWVLSRDISAGCEGHLKGFVAGECLFFRVVAAINYTEITQKYCRGMLVAGKS